MAALIELIAGQATQVPHYFHHDQLGSTRVLTNASGNTSATFTYDAYGALKTKTGSAVTALGFTGQYTDAETGFQYLRARYYDPATGQFVSRDPMLEITEQPYSYADGDPLNFSDPAGLWRPPSWKWRSGSAASARVPWLGLIFGRAATAYGLELLGQPSPS